MSRRNWQQVRLWAYLVLAVSIMYYAATYQPQSFAAFIALAVLLFLPYIERCSLCRKLVWRERYNEFGPLWIGMHCKDRRNDTD